MQSGMPEVVSITESSIATRVIAGYDPPLSLTAGLVCGLDAEGRADLRTSASRPQTRPAVRLSGGS